MKDHEILDATNEILTKHKGDLAGFWDAVRDISEKIESEEGEGEGEVPDIFAGICMLFEDAGGPRPDIDPDVDVQGYMHALKFECISDEQVDERVEFLDHLLRQGDISPSDLELGDEKMDQVIPIIRKSLAMFQFGAYQMTMMGQTVNVGMFQMPKDFPDKLGRFIGELFCREWVKPDFLTEYSEMLSASQGIHWRRRVMSAVFYAIKERSEREGGREGQSVEDWMKELEYDYMEHLEEQSIADQPLEHFLKELEKGKDWQSHTKFRNTMLALTSAA